jgi:hypothetical protein
VLEVQRVTKNGRTYVVREGKLIEIINIPVRGVDTKAIKATRGQRHVGFPWAFLVDVSRRTTGKAAVLMAEYIYRRVHVCKSQTVTLPGAELKELGIDRARKSRVLVQLAHAGFIRIEKDTPGRTSKVTLLWES